MKIFNRLRLGLLCALVSLAGCSTLFQDPYFQYGSVGGLVGTGVGAGTGVLVASLIPNGDLATSALLGAGVGLPVGILAGVAYRSYVEDKEIRENNEKIRANYEYIVARQYEIDRTREELIDESFRLMPDKSRREYIYTGPTIGTYNR